MRRWEAGSFDLETFLVEWKLFKSAVSDKKVIYLETFLVEWKPLSMSGRPVGRITLETFLVEWKPILGIDSRGMVLTLKPS